MRISRLLIINYKSCSFIDLNFEVDEPIVLVGPNDSGKTTILNSFKFLFNEKEAVFFGSEGSGKNDLSINQIGEGCIQLLNEEFPDFGKQDAISFLFKLDFSSKEIESLLLLEKFAPLLKLIVSRKQSIWIRKTISRQGFGYFVMAEDIKVESDKDSVELKFEEFWAKRDTDLNKLMTEDLKKKIINRNNEGKPTLFEKVEVLYSNNYKGFVNRWIGIEHKELKPLFPEFEAFTWNFDLNSIYSLATSFIDSDDKAKIRAIRESANVIESEIAQKIKDKMVPTLSTIQDSVPSIKDLFAKIYIDITHKITDVLVRKAGFEGDIHVDSQGEGLKRQIWFSLLKSRAQQSIDKGDVTSSFVWTFDEPEIHLYPKAQRDFFESLKQLSLKGFQIFINSHSSIFVNKAALSNVYQVRVEGGVTNISRCQKTSDVIDSLEVQNSDILFYNRFMLVEGITEISFFSYLLKKLHGKDISSMNTKLIDLTGATNTKTALSSLLKIFEETNHTSSSLFILLDRDQENNHRHLIDKYNVDYFGTYDLEDSLSNEVWENYLKLAFTDERFHLKADVIELIRSQMGPQSNKKFMSILKSHLVMKSADGDHGLVNLSKNKKHGELLALAVIETKMDGNFKKYLDFIME